MSLSSIPADIRIQIWRLLLTRPCPVDILLESTKARKARRNTCCPSSLDTSDVGCQYLECLQRRRSPDTGPFARYGWICVGPKFSIGVLLTCRLMYEEAIKVLYEGNKFILSTTSAESFPVFDFSRIRSLHIDVQHLKREPPLPSYKKIIQKIKLDPEARLTITTSFEEQNDSVNFISAAQSLGPVKLCTLSLTWVTEAASLAARLMNIQKKPPVSVQYNKLPEELRYHILSYTDLVQDYRMRHGRIAFKNDCCRSCCETLFGCCCIRSSRISSLIRHRSNVIKSQFSETCQCKRDPLPLLQVSPDFQRDALRVLFARSRFEFTGRIVETFHFFHKIERHLKLLREIVLDMDYKDFDDWEHGTLPWDAFIGYVEAHLLLPLLSLKIIASYALWSNEPLPLSRVEHIRVFYWSLIPGLSRLTAKGLTRFSVQFRQEELKDWKDTYEREVMGIEDIPDT